MKSSLKNMILSLTGLTAAVGAALGGVFIATEEPIAEAELRARTEAIGAVLPPFDNDILTTAENTPGGLTIYKATNGGVPAGMAVETYSDRGFSGRISLIVGFTPDGVLSGYRILHHEETPGLGAKAAEWFAQPGHDVTGTASPIVLKADGGDIDAITGATITSRAFAEAVNRARETFDKYKDQRP